MRDLGGYTIRSVAYEIYFELATGALQVLIDFHS
jgi:hypothetical protein